ncbi:adenylate/guanylate cyclase domain-containing protein [Bradyrhizobium sp. RT3a]|uniref:adenylate/guanylate cyclase domain-containing protein n=1 Tax=unclassified Bradyrhizobium TaxID=2631580 RepID=UPI00339A08A2
MRERQRRLVGIFAADVAGYSRLMDADESATVEGLNSQRAILDELIEQHGGRIANTAGDSVLAEFESVQAAVACASLAQTKLAASQSNIEEAKKIRFRIGVHLGDVIPQGHDILGDGVNIASRLQVIAKPGQVVVSAAVHDQIHKQARLKFIDLGWQQLKNIGSPVRAYAISSPNEHVGVSRATSVSDDGRPSIAVLPFKSLSVDAEHQYFADGLVEDIITALSRNPMLVVIARQSSFSYKGKTFDIKQVGRELGVRYALEGSVRRAGNKIRINSQLADTESGTHVWADRFDGAAEDIFELQDRISENVAGVLDVEVTGAEIKRLRRRPTNDLSAYNLLVRGLSCFYGHTYESTGEALEYFRQAIELDPRFAIAYGYAAATLILRRSLGWITDAKRNEHECISLSEKAVVNGGDDAEALSLAAMVQIVLGYELRASVELATKSLKLNSNSPHGWYVIGISQLAQGNLDDAVKAIGRGIRLNPRDPAGYVYMTSYALTQFLRSNFPDAIEFADKALAARPTWVPALRVKAASLAAIGDVDAAKATFDRVKAVDPTGAASVMQRMIQLQPHHLSSYIEALRKAGMGA